MPTCGVIHSRRPRQITRLPLPTPQVVKYIEQLRAVRRNQITTAEIGVITPYHKQVRPAAFEKPRGGDR